MKTKLTLVLTFILLFFKTSFSQKDEINVLFLGNSYVFVNNLPEIISEMTEGTSKSIKYESVTPGGHTLFQHVVNQNSLSLIRKGSWDYVVLQEQSQLPSIDYYRHNAMRPAYQSLYDSIMLYNPEATVVGYMTWGRRFGGQQCENYGEGLYCSADFVDFNHMQDTMSIAYRENAYATDSYVAPVGDAWKTAFDSIPELVLHSSDDSHPNYDGSYLAACVFYSVFWKESPIGTYHSEDIDDEKARFFQTIANDVVFNNLEKWNISIDDDGGDDDGDDDGGNDDGNDDDGDDDGDGDGDDDGNDDGNDNESIESINDKKYRIINNPNDSNIMIESKSGSSINVKVYNLNGILLNEKDITDSGNIELNNTKGIHIVQITEGSNNLTFSEKVIKY